MAEKKPNRSVTGGRIKQRRVCMCGSTLPPEGPWLCERCQKLKAEGKLDEKPRKPNTRIKIVPGGSPGLGRRSR